MIAGTWWCFTLIMVSSYTANLASFLIVQELEESFSSLKELASQNKIQYGCLQNGSTMKFFQVCFMLDSDFSFLLACTTKFYISELK